MVAVTMQVEGVITQVAAQEVTVVTGAAMVFPLHPDLLEEEEDADLAATIQLAQLRSNVPHLRLALHQTIQALELGVAVSLPAALVADHIQDGTLVPMGLVQRPFPKRRRPSSKRRANASTVKKLSIWPATAH